MPKLILTNPEKQTQHELSLSESAFTQITGELPILRIVGVGQFVYSDTDGTSYVEYEIAREFTISGYTHDGADVAVFETADPENVL